jgi:hypothetical protein
MIKGMRMRWAGNAASMVTKRNACRILVGKPEGKRPRRTWEDNIKMDLREIRWIWTRFAWLRTGTSGGLL